MLSILRPSVRAHRASSRGNARLAKAFRARAAKVMEAMLDFCRSHVLRTRREQAAAIAEIDPLLDVDPKRGSAAHDRLEFLSVLAEAYENEHLPVDETRG